MRNLEASEKYWHLVWEIQTKDKCGISEARTRLHARADLSKVKGDWEWERIVSFMEQFPNAPDVERDGSEEHLWEFLPDNPTLDDCISALRSSDRDQLCWWLAHAERYEFLKGLYDDPIFGYTAKFEHENKLGSIRYRAEEKARQEAMHPNLQKLQDIGNGFRWICSLHYPWVHPNHNVPNCLTVLNDGFPAFRFEVLDPGVFTRFRVAEILDKDNHWFPFAKCGVVVDRVMDLQQVAGFLVLSQAASNNRDYALLSSEAS